MKSRQGQVLSLVCFLEHAVYVFPSGDKDLLMANNSIGRIPPHSDDAEVALLGSILLRNKSLDEVQNDLVKEDFYQRGHQLIWEALIGLRTDRPSLAIDLMSLTQYMSQKGTLAEAGGAAYIASLTDSVPSSTNASYYAEIIRTASLKRRLLDLSIRIGDAAFDETQDVKESIDELDQQITALGTNVSTTSYRDVSTIITQVVNDIQDRQSGKKTVGVKSGFKTLDKYIGGFKPSDFVIIAARPSVGKTALALSIAVNMAFGDNPVPVGFFSLEMSGASLMERVISNKGNIKLSALRNDRIDSETNNRIVAVASNLYDRAGNLLVQDTPNIKLLEIRSQARRMVREHGVKAIFIDYIGLIELGGSANMPRHEQVSIISRQLKQIARELSIPVICLCQVNREGGKDRPPILADLRDSGSIEQDADLVILLDDPSKRLDENNKIAQYEEDDGEEGNEGAEDSKAIRPLKIILAKHRNGSTGAFKVNFQAEYVAFRDIEKF